MKKPYIQQKFYLLPSSIRLTLLLAQLILFLRIPPLRFNLLNDRLFQPTHSLALLVLVEQDVAFVLDEETLRERAVECVERGLYISR